MSETLACAVLDDQSVLCATSTTKLIQRPAGAAAIRQLAPGYELQLSAVYEDGLFSPEVTEGLSAPHLLNGRSLVTTMATSRGTIDFWCWVRVGGGTVCEGSAGDVHPDPTMVLSQLVAGTNFLCGLRPDGGVRCWGTFAGCRAGAPDLSYWCDGQPSSDQSHEVALGQRAVSIATNSDLVRLACAVLADGSVKCWGGAECVRLDGADGSSSGCQAPEQQDPVIGDSVEIKPGPNGRIYGAWRAIDLGAHS